MATPHCHAALIVPSRSDDIPGKKASQGCFILAPRGEKTIAALEIQNFVTKQSQIADATALTGIQGTKPPWRSLNKIPGFFGNNTNDTAAAYA